MKNLTNYLKENDIDPEVIEFEKLVKLDGEEWKDLKTDLYPDIKPVYIISNKNRIYSNLTHKLLKPKIKKYGNGYYQVKLQTTKGGKTFSMHRLMMIIFCPIENMMNLVINHKDGDKTNNDLSNLEWCTSQYNTIHAYNTGLAKGKRGEEASNVNITEATAKEICKLFQEAELSCQQIADKLSVPKSTVVSITTGAGWKWLSEKYDFSKREVFRNSPHFSNKEIHTFCKYFETHKRESNMSVRKYLFEACEQTGYFKNHNINDINNIYYALRGIYLKKYFKKIVSQYNY